jgi:hypothetical protein
MVFNLVLGMSQCVGVIFPVNIFIAPIFLVADSTRRQFAYLVKHALLLRHTMVCVEEIPGQDSEWNKALMDLPLFSFIERDGAKITRARIARLAENATAVEVKPRQTSMPKRFIVWFASDADAVAFKLTYSNELNFKD